LSGLTPEQVLELHEQLLELHGGLPGLRDAGLLESALAQPTQELFGMMRYADVPAQAAVYLDGLVKNHAFNDGNKRTAIGCALLWLAANGWQLPVGDPELFALTVSVAENQLERDELIAWFQAHCHL
jgi:death on curing protein